MFSATLFDYNGVLVDDEHAHLEAFRDALAPLGLSLTDDEYVARYLGYDDRGAFRAILEDRGHPADEALVLALIEAKKPFYLARAERALTTFPGAEEVIRRCARFGPVAVVSGALRAEIALGLRVLGVEDVVEHVVSAEDTRACKPDPEGYFLGRAYLAEKLGSELAERALVVEDSLAGVQAAKAAGLACAAVTHSYSRAELVGAGADLVIDALDDLSAERITLLARSLHGEE